MRPRNEVKICINCSKVLSRNGDYQCRKCYEKTHNATKSVCKQCGGKLSPYASTGNKLCRKCYEFNRSNQGHPWQNKDILETLYLIKKMSMKEISDLLNCGSTTINKWLKKFDIPCRKTSSLALKEGVIGINKYIYITINGKQIPEHRFIVEQFINRKLTKSEIIHHTDGDKSNNKLSNLYLFTRSKHIAFHNSPYPINSNLYKFVNER